MNTNRRIITVVTATLIAFGSFAGGAKAATIEVDGGFSVTYNPAHPFYQDVPFLDGTWSLTFDDQGGSFTGNVSGSISTFSLITVGATDFDESNTSATIFLDAGFIESITLLGGTGNPSTDYFTLFYSYPLVGADLLGFAEVSAASVPPSGPNPGFIRVTRDGDPNFGISEGFFIAVPEPSSALLVGIGSLGILARRRRTR